VIWINYGGGTNNYVYTSPTAASGSWTLRATVTLPNNISPKYNTNCLLYDPITHNLVVTFQAGTEVVTSRAKYSNDGGTTWADPTGISNLLAQGGELIARVNKTTGTIIACWSAATPAAYYRSTDGGVTYTEKTFAGTTGLTNLSRTLYPYKGSGNVWLFNDVDDANFSEAYLSVDDGLTWEQIEITADMFNSQARISDAYSATSWFVTQGLDGTLVRADYGVAETPTTFFLPYLDNPTNINSLYTMYVKVL
jgi:hypothetical protein